MGGLYVRVVCEGNMGEYNESLIWEGRMVG